MKRWLVVALSGLVAVLIMVVASISRFSAAREPAGRMVPTAPVKVVTEMLDQARLETMKPAQWVAIARRSGIIVLNSWDYQLIPILKRANPAVQVWVYKDLSGIRSDDCLTATGNCGSCAPGVIESRFLSSGMGYCWVRRHHPDWLLRSAAGDRPLEFKGYPSTWETDYGNGAYLRRWIRNVIADVHRHGWDGVKVDNALTTAYAYGRTRKYRTNAAVQHATYSALREVSDALRRAGVRSVFNVGYATIFPGLWQRWLRVVDGLQQEFYLSFSTRPDAVGEAWTAYQAEISACVAQHKSCWFHAGSHSSMVTSQTRSYALASYLLASDDNQYLALGNSTAIPMAPCWSVGRALVPARSAAGTTWSRTFTRGITVVNPTSVSVTAQLGRTYYNIGGHAVSVIRLGPASGAILAATRPHSCH